MSTGITKQANGGARLSEWLAQPDQIQRFEDALGGYMDARLYVAQILIFFQKPEIAECTAASQFEVALKCASFGFVPNLNHVAIIPRNAKTSIQGREQWVKVATMMPQWQGYKALMERHPDIHLVTPRIVFDHEVYEYDEETGAIKHFMDPFDPKRVCDKDLKNLRGGYVVIEWKDGRKQFHYVTADHIRKSRECSEPIKKRNAGEQLKFPPVWDLWTDSMVLKTILRDCYSKRAVPIDPFLAGRLSKLVNDDDEAMEVKIEQPINLPPPSPSRTSRASQVVAGLGYTPEPTTFEPSEPAGEPVPAKASKPKADKTVEAAPKDLPPNVCKALEQWASAVHRASDEAKLDELKKSLSSMSTLTEAEWDEGITLIEWKAARL